MSSEMDSVKPVLPIAYSLKKTFIDTELPIFEYFPSKFWPDGEYDINLTIYQYSDDITNSSAWK